MRLYIQKDKANDQVYVGFSSSSLKGARAKKTVWVTGDIALDLDARGGLIGMDVSRASHILGRGVFSEDFSGDELIGVAEAAKLCGVKKPNFVRDLASRADFPGPIVELASGRIWRRSEVLSFLKTIGRDRPRRNAVAAA